MTELNPLKWQEIFSQLVEEGHYDVGSVNYYHLTSILEDLYVENQELKSRVEALEKDMELIKSYAWEKDPVKQILNDPNDELDRLIARIPTEGAMAMSEPIRKALEALPND